MRRRLFLLTLLLMACNHSMQHASDPDLPPRRPESTPLRGAHEAWIQDLFVPEDLDLDRPIQVGINGWGFAPPWERYVGLGVEVNARKKTVKIRMLLARDPKKGKGGVHMIYPATASFTLHDPGVYTILGSRGDASASITLRAHSEGPHPFVTTLAQLPEKAAPRGIACDQIGQFYVTDSCFHAVWKGTPDGHFSLFAGGGSGFRDGPGRTARFSFPTGITVDGKGIVFVADTGNHRIRRISPDGMVTTLAGGGATGWFQGGFQDGPAGKARFNHPTGIVVDRQGTLYVTDTDNERIRRISSGRVSSLKLGFPFLSPEGLALDGKGTLYIVDDSEHLYKLARGKLWAVPMHGRTRIGEIDGLGCDEQGNLFVLDGSHKRIRKIAPSGLVSPLAGLFYFFQDGEGPIACFRDPSGITVGPDGNLYVADTGNGRIRKICF